MEERDPQIGRGGVGQAGQAGHVRQVRQRGRFFKRTKKGKVNMNDLPRETDLQKTQFFLLQDIFLLPKQTKEPLLKLLVEKGWKFFVTNQNRGVCYYKTKWITIPMYVYTSQAKESGEFCYYIAHEMAHAVCFEENILDKGTGHGPNFMRVLKNLCPVAFQHFELEYKPRQAMRSGINSLASLGIGDDGIDPFI